jgi:hypothetical protein
MAIRSDVFQKLGGFNVAYLKSHDVEFSERAKRLGCSIGLCPDAVVAYRLRSDLRGLAVQGFRGGRAAAQSCADGLVAPRSLSSAFYDWWWLAIRVPTLVSVRRRGIWVRRASEALGRLAGSIRSRVSHF